MNYLYIIGSDLSIPAEDGLTAVNVPVADWNDMLSPWYSEGLRKGECFSGKARDFLAHLEDLIAAAEQNAKAERRGIIGYSLAGLFSLWAALETDLFDCAASISGSLWYDGWDEYISRYNEKRRCAYVYLSLGDKESKAGPARMRNVETNTMLTLNCLRASDISAEFFSNPGGHFNYPEERIRKGVAALADCLAKGTEK